VERIPSCRVRNVVILVLLAFLIAGCGPKDAKPLIESAKLKFAATNFNGAVSDYTEALRADPKNVEALKGRAIAKFRLGELNAALFDMNAALVLNPDDQELLIGRAAAYAALGQTTNANADFSKLQRLDPTNAAKAKFTIAQGILRRARGLSAGGDNASALVDYDKVIGLFPDVGVAYHERGFAKLELKRYKEAIADFDLAIKYDEWVNQFGDTHALRAKAKRAVGDTNGAAADEREAQKRSSATKSRDRAVGP
jgi:tetratricopeptide (TPR) repeat protein